MKLLLGIAGILFYTALAAQQKPLATAMYAGIYSYGSDPEKERTGTATIFADSDTSALFYLDLNRGAPNNNLGSLYGRMWLRDSSGIYYQGYCRMIFRFSKGALSIQSFTRYNDCGFGYGVTAQGAYSRTAQKSPDFFLNPEGRKVVFLETSPEQYYKR